jgi:hypothetical protein
MSGGRRVGATEKARFVDNFPSQFFVTVALTPITFFLLAISP